MQHKQKRVQFTHRAIQVQEIAQGIYDKTDRQFVLQFVQDAQKLVEVAPPEVILTVLGDAKLKG